MIRQLLTFIVLGLMTYGLYYFVRKQEKKSLVKRKAQKNYYGELRAKAMNVTPEILQLKIKDSAKVFGVVMDQNIAGQILTLVAFMTGDASLYFSSGQMFIGGFKDKIIVDLAKKLVQKSNAYLSKASLVQHTEPSTGNKVNFYFLTPQGRYYIEEEIEKIENPDAELYELFLQAHQIIGRFRILEQGAY